ncbi:MAG: shikimate kinase [Acidimicrobiales bacterium]
MGSGKTTVGEIAARRTGWPHLDSDVEVEQATGMSVKEIFELRGEQAFRSEERKALTLALSFEPAVVSVAGGAVLDPANREVIRGAGTVVWLRATVETLAKRVGDGHGRPLLGSDPEGSLRRLDAVRRPLYQQVATTVVDVDQRSAAEVAQAALCAMEEPSS